ENMVAGGPPGQRRTGTGVVGCCLVGVALRKLGERCTQQRARGTPRRLDRGDGSFPAKGRPATGNLAGPRFTSAGGPWLQLLARRGQLLCLVLSGRERFPRLSSQPVLARSQQRIRRRSPVSPGQ